ncbi:MAG: glycosyltransferase family 2 protein [Bacilli bacterium]|nr:glycosyltransferase family 2 protein [Bacilli bacterium]
MNKKVSIIVPVYNSSKYLSHSLNSLIKQTYKNLEIILIDDASTDKSAEIIKKFSLKDDRIIPFYSELNQGVSKARNRGLKTFSGDYVLFVDSDDYLVEDAIEIMVKTAEEYDSDFVDSYHLLIYETKKKKYYFTENKVPKKIEVMGSLKDNIKVLDKYTYINGKLIKKELIRNMYFDETLSRYEDLVFEHELKKKVKNMVFLNDVLYYYFQVPTSLTNSLGLKHACYLDAAKKVIDNYSDSSKEIKLKIESILFTNAFLTLVSKVIKNDLSIENNITIVKEYLGRFDDIFKTWKTNNYINKIIKKYVIKLKKNDKKIRKLIKKTKKINFINLYFKFMSFRYDYKRGKK